MKEAFREYKFQPRVLARIQLANSILEDLARQGYSISLRQLYYQLVSRGEIPNSQKEYKKLGDTLSKARLAGLVDWRSLEDRGRSLKGADGSDESPAEWFSALENSYWKEWWRGQENYVEVWVEKDALAGVVERPCTRHRVKYFSCRGYSSQSEQYAAGKRFARAARQGKTCHVIHLGDHDPSGLDMTRDNQDRLDMFSENNVEVRRIALNMNQIEELNPPPNPAKMTDARVGGYIAAHGRSSWELDALPPAYIDNIIDEAIRELIDTEALDAVKAQEEEERSEVSRIVEAIGSNYEDVTRLLRDNDYI